MSAYIERARLRGLGLRTDWERFTVVPVDAQCLLEASEIGRAAKIRTLDAIHLAAAARLPKPLVFVTFDRRQAAVAPGLGLQLAMGLE